MASKKVGHPTNRRRPGVGHATRGRAYAVVMDRKRTVTVIVGSMIVSLGVIGLLLFIGAGQVPVPPAIFLITGAAWFVKGAATPGSPVVRRARVVALIGSGLIVLVLIATVLDYWAHGWS